MRSRTKLLISALVAGSALAAAIPAQAQNYPQGTYSQDGRYDTNRDGRIDQRDGYDTNRDGRIDQRDAYDANRDGRYNQNDQRWDQNDRRWNNNGNANAIRQQIEQLRFRVSRSDSRDRISEREAAGLRRAVNQLELQFRDYSRNGLTQRETRYLQDRINQVRSRLQYERNDRDGRRY